MTSNEAYKKAKVFLEKEQNGVEPGQGCEFKDCFAFGIIPEGTSWAMATGLIRVVVRKDNGKVELNKPGIDDDIISMRNFIKLITEEELGL